jgi:hypothetical protein
MLFLEVSRTLESFLEALQENLTVLEGHRRCDVHHTDFCSSSVVSLFFGVPVTIIETSNTKLQD